jgi:DNA polymerase-3 subunit gamma/tau
VELCAEQGRDAESFTEDLETRTRELLVVQTLGDVPAELALTPEADQGLLSQSGRVPAAVVVRLLELLGEAKEAMRAGADARTRLELALVKGARPEVDGSTRALLARIERLERGAGPSRPEQPAPPSAPAAAASLEPAPVAPAPEMPAAAGDPSPPAPEQPPAAPATPAAPGAEGSDLEMVSSLWTAVVDLVRSENALLGALIADAAPTALDGEELTLTFASTAQFLKKKAEDPANKTIVGNSLQAITGVRVRLTYALGEESEPRPAGEPAGERSGEEWVRRLMDEFDAEEVHGEWDPESGEEPGREQERGGEAVTSNEKGA